MDPFVAEPATLPPVIVFVHELFIGSEVAVNVFLLRLDWSWAMGLVGRIQTDHRPHVAAFTNDAFGKPAGIALVTHIGLISQRTRSNPGSPS